jgi:hypothetical protein
MTDITSTLPLSSYEVGAKHKIELPTGDLTIEVHRSDIPLDQLCGFAARRNPKRGFLFVSKVLGKHIPVRPSLMRHVHTLLAAKIPPNLPGPVVVVGMAETAIALGHGVYEEYVRLSRRTDTLFIHSTRYRLDRPVALEFREEHSHAADHIIYCPDDPAQHELCENARSLVLIDDEASTGATFVNLAQAFKARFPKLENIVTGVITDWRGPARTAATQAKMPVTSSSISILEGEYNFSAAPSLVAMEMPKSTGNGDNKDELIVRNYGRHGVSGRQKLATEPYRSVQKMLSEKGRTVSKQKVLVLGTGEFAYPPFVLAEELDAAGFDVHYQSTTRSPALIHGALTCGLTFSDNYGDGIANYVYNVAPGLYDRVIIVHETPAGSIDKSLVDELGADTLEM